MSNRMAVYSPGGENRRQPSSPYGTAAATSPYSSAITRSPSSVNSVTAAKTNNLLTNFRQDDVVYALMAQLKQKDAEISILTNQRSLLVQEKEIADQISLQYKKTVDMHNRTTSGKDTKIALLQQKLYQERKGSGSAIAEANLSHLAETNIEYKRILKERDDELAHLHPLLNQLKSKIEEYSTKESVQYTQELENEVKKLKGGLIVATEETNTVISNIEDFEKKVKSKEWMIKSLQEENEDQRSRENRLTTQINTLSETVQEYETKFEGKGVDVPMLLAKLKDYEVRTKDFEGQISRLTNDKLNDLVMISKPTISTTKDDDIDSLTSDENDNSSFDSNGSSKDGSNEIDNWEDVMKNMKFGIETLEAESWAACCVQDPPTGPLSPESYAPLSPMSYASPMSSRAT